jgi:DNA-directed RNA polymerase subunit RPC12/RpoP
MPNFLNEDKYYRCSECGGIEFKEEFVRVLYRDLPNRDPNYYEGVPAAAAKNIIRYVCANCGAPLKRGV